MLLRCMQTILNITGILLSEKSLEMLLSLSAHTPNLQFPLYYLSFLFKGVIDNVNFCWNTFFFCADAFLCIWCSISHVYSVGHYWRCLCVFWRKGNVLEVHVNEIKLQLLYSARLGRYFYLFVNLCLRIILMDFGSGVSREESSFLSFTS